jgi:polyisoprenoid-binding protein YceI
MKRFLLFLFPCFLMSFASVELKPSDGDNSVTFTIKNFGINTKGEFRGLKGNIKWDAENPANSSFDVSVDVHTINTGIELRDKDLMKESYFDAEKYPTIKFVSTKVSADNVTGNLTIKNVTKNISFPFSVSPSGKGYLFKGDFSINRRDFNVGGGGVLGENVDVKLNVLASP